MNILCITQARLGSTRLADKVLLEIIDNQTLVDCHMARVGRSKLVSKHILAIPESKQNLTLKEHCEHREYSCFTGCEYDVLTRFKELAQHECLQEDDLIVRLTGDCPLICPDLIDFVIDRHLTAKKDYTSLDLRYHPRGFDVEVFNYRALLKAHKSCVDIDFREHVTPYIYDATNNFRLQSVSCGNVKWSKYRLCIDYKEDLELIISIARKLKDWLNADHKEICNFLDENYSLSDINSQSVQRRLHSSSS